MSREKLKALFDAALKVDVRERGEFLEQACAGDEELRREVESLIQSYEEGEGFLSGQALEDAAQALAQENVQLGAGRVIGSYEIFDRIGVGGMGEVYRARDRDLGREVAIKVLPEVFSRDRRRLRRFQREAQLLASLNHPNIAAIYGLEESDGMQFLVLELVPGPTLAEKLEKGRLLVEEALEFCRQIAEGLEAAHEKGIIHRDLKPANIKITPEDKVKLLDFGLAKVFERETAPGDRSQSRTGGTGTTETGVILGTAAYMSPEQARGKPMDKRTDIWSFGCVLYECLAGKQLFRGETPTDILAAIVNQEIDLQWLRQTTPAPIRSLLRRCLQKDLHKRLHDIGDARIEIEEVLADTSGAWQAPVSALGPGSWRRAILLALVGLLAGVLIASVAFWNLKPQPPEEPRPVVRSTITPPETGPLIPSHYVPDVAMSSDGRHVVYLSELARRSEAVLPAHIGSVGGDAYPWHRARGGELYPFFLS